MATKRFDILITGELAGFDLLLAEHLSRRGLHCAVARRATPSGSPPQPAGTYTSYHTHFSPDDVVGVGTGMPFLALARQSRLIVSLTGALVGALGRVLWPLRHTLGLPPVINITTGSDIIELATEKSVRGWCYRQYLRFAALNWIAPYPQALSNVIALRVPNIVFMRFPYYLVGETNPHGGLPMGRIRFFHPSNLDWKASDPGAQRYSSKGNDRFIRAFARAVDGGMDAECVFLDRGKDRALARALVSTLRLDNRVIWKPQLTRDELREELGRADIVVDQFDVGIFGGIAAEAMSMGKPVLIYLCESSMRLLYAELPPVLNAHREEEIHDQILRCRDRHFAQELGARAREWVYRHHHWDSCLDEFLFFFTLLTGQRVVDYGWDRDPYAEAGSRGLTR